MTKQFLRMAVGGVVRGDGLFAWTLFCQRADARTARTSTDCAGHKYQRRRQRGDVHDDVRAAGGGIRIAGEFGGWTPFRARIRERMEHAQGPAVEALREFYKSMS